MVDLPQPRPPVKAKIRPPDGNPFPDTLITSRLVNELE